MSLFTLGCIPTYPGFNLRLIAYSSRHPRECIGDGLLFFLRSAVVCWVAVCSRWMLEYDTSALPARPNFRWTKLRCMRGLIQQLIPLPSHHFRNCHPLFRAHLLAAGLFLRPTFLEFYILSPRVVSQTRNTTASFEKLAVERAISLR